MRVPALASILIVVVCATAGLVLGWLFPLTPSHHHRGVEHPHATMAPRPDIGTVRESEERPAPEGRREDEHVTQPPSSPPAVLQGSETASSPEQVQKSDGRASSAEHVTETFRTSNDDENVRTSSQPAGRTPAPPVADAVTLPSVDAQGPEAKPRNNTEARQSKRTRELARGPSKAAQKPASYRTRQQRDDDDPPEREKDRPAREKQPTRSIVSQLPIVGPVFGLLIP